MKILSRALVLCSLTSIAHAQISWESLDALPALTDAKAAFHELSESVVVFGGVGPMGTTPQTWSLSKSGWILHPTGSPPPRISHAMTYDAKRQVIVMFGGNGHRQDTWEWNGAPWTQITTLGGPSARVDLALAYDSTRDRLVLFGGRAAPVSQAKIFTDTWEWDGTTWQELLPFVVPSPQSLTAGRGLLPVSATDPVDRLADMAGTPHHGCAGPIDRP